MSQLKAHLQQLAAYNSWANAHLYAAALALPDEAYRRDIGLFFGSIHATLNHLAYTDRMWMGRIDDSEHLPGPLDSILHEDRSDLARTRIALDERLIAMIDAVEHDSLDRNHNFRNTSGKEFSQPLGQIFAHILNHQTHHRGQAHSGLALLAIKPPPLDLLMFQRGAPAPDLADLLGDS